MKMKRVSADYFDQMLPKANPLAEDPTKQHRYQPGERALKAVMPYYLRDRPELGEDDEYIPQLPEDQKWEHLIEVPDSELDPAKAAADKSDDDVPGIASDEEHIESVLGGIQQRFDGFQAFFRGCDPDSAQHPVDIIKGVDVFPSNSDQT